MIQVQWKREIPPEPKVRCLAWVCRAHLNQAGKSFNNCERRWAQTTSYRKSQRSTNSDLFVKQMKLIGCQSLLHPLKRIKSHHTFELEQQKRCQTFVCFKCFYFSLSILKKYRIQVKNQPPKRDLTDLTTQPRWNPALLHKDHWQPICY